jgi:DNA-directed RNA polymerase specialized sigma24 family protein
VPQDFRTWPPLSDAYQDVFGEIELDVYNAAGAIWQRGRGFARSQGIDDGISHTAMIRAVAKVSRRQKGSDPYIKTPGALKAYLFTAFRRCLLDEIKDKKTSAGASLEDLEAVADESSSDSLAIKVEKKILLEEIVRHMDDKTRSIYERLILGYSFEEIAETMGTQSNVLRSKFSKKVRRIASEFAGLSSNVPIVD